MSRPNRGLRKLAVLAAKIGISAGLIVFVFRSHSVAAAINALSSETGAAGVSGAIVLLTLQSLLAGVRQVQVAAIFGRTITLLNSLRIWMAGLFVGQVLVTFVAGDFVRGVFFADSGLPRRSAAQAIAFDRLIGLVLLLAMVLASIPFLYPYAGDPFLERGLTGLAILAAGGILAVAVAGAAWHRFRMPHLPKPALRLLDIAFDLAAVLRFLPRDRPRATMVVLLGLAMHVLNCIAFGVLSYFLGGAASPVAVSIAAVPALFLSMLPISFSGWGVREAATITLLGMLGISSDIALAISIGFGAAQLISSLPGCIFVLDVVRMRSPNDELFEGETAKAKTV